MNKYYSDRPLNLMKVSPGDKLPPLTKQANAVDTVRFCSAIRNFHRFHYDQEFTSKQGIDGIIVPGFLMGNWCIEAVSRSIGREAEIASLKFRNTATAPINQDYQIVGEIVSIDRTNPLHISCNMTVKKLETDEIVTTAVVGVRITSCAQSERQ